MEADESPVFTLRCHLHIRVTDIGAVIEQAVNELREADIDWSQEEEELEDAVAALRNDAASALASLVEPWTLFGNRPGVEIRAGRVWVDAGAAGLSEE